MTGAEFRVMKFTKAVRITLMTVMMTSAAQAAQTATAIMTIDVTLTQPGCDIQVPSLYNLGILTPGGKEHAPLNITWTCEGNTPIKTALSASIVKGTAIGDEKVILQTDNGSDSGAMLSLKEKTNGRPIKLTGPTQGHYFCSDAVSVAGVMRNCTLIPETQVAQNGPFGLVSAILRFEVGYP
ncbi:F18 fimbrial protein FedE [Escherichia coli]|nr:F18 fimbrial protein FedE [Escherichia coli]EKQ3042767.1 F18 fimbrial protein FedE [Salmonella enterica]MBW0927513.1 F18 fimbrial protein FedE [Shigella sonnei]UMU70177.1 F18 fimbrial protein FedE [Shigella flexneri]EFB4766776.1 F18 fimbrial protein FedE [Escherichia coli]